MTRHTKTLAAVVFGSLAFVTFDASPSSANVHPPVSVTASKSADRFPGDILPTDIAKPGLPNIGVPASFKVAAGPTRKAKRFQVRRPRNTSAQQVQTRRTFQNGNSGLTSGQGRAPQADGIFNSSDLIQVFSAGEYKD